MVLPLVEMISHPRLHNTVLPSVKVESHPHTVAPLMNSHPGPFQSGPCVPGVTGDGTVLAPPHAPNPIAVKPKAPTTAAADIIFLRLMMQPLGQFTIGPTRESYAMLLLWSSTWGSMRRRGWQRSLAPSSQRTDRRSGGSTHFRCLRLASVNPARRRDGWGVISSTGPKAHGTETDPAFRRTAATCRLPRPRRPGR
jgi:hypothetical protein